MSDTDGGQAASLLDRMLAAGIPADRAHRWLEAGAVQVAGERTTDPAAVVPHGTTWMINPQ